MPHISQKNDIEVDIAHIHRFSRHEIEEPASDGFGDGFKAAIRQACFKCGRASLRRFPSIDQFVREKAPEGIRNMRRGVESTFCLIILLQAMLMGIWAWSFATAFIGSQESRFLSLEVSYDPLNGEPLCSEVPVSLNEEYSLDDYGFWSTNPKWGFASTMLGIRTRGFETTIDVWKGQGAVALYKQFRDWNALLVTLGSSAAVTAMVTLDSPIKVKGSKENAIYAQVLADPTMTMQAQYQWNLGMSENTTAGTYYFFLTYEDNGDKAMIGAPKNEFTNAFPRWNFNTQGEDDDFFPADTLPVSLEMNKYSIYVAAAVNMGLLSVADLVDLADSGFSDDDGGDDDFSFDDDEFNFDDDVFFDDDWVGGDDNFAFLDDADYAFDDDLLPSSDDSVPPAASPTTASATTAGPTTAVTVATTAGPTPAVTAATTAGPTPAVTAATTTGPTPAGSGRRRQRRLQAGASSKKRGSARSRGPVPREKSDLKERLQAASRRTLDDPTPEVFKTTLGELKSYVTRKFYDEMEPILCSLEASRCFLRVGGSVVNPRYGATLFPIIQNYDKNCLHSDGASRKSCNDLDIEYMFYFDKEEPAIPTWFDYKRTDYKHYYLDDSGMSGLLMVNLYYGVEFLTKAFYKLPATHCTKPVAITESEGGFLACGSPNAVLAVKKKKGSKKYCNALPVKPQEVFYNCKLAKLDIFFSSVGAACGFMGSIGGFLTIGLMLFATHVLGLKPLKPKEEEASSGERSGTGL